MTMATTTTHIALEADAWHRQGLGWDQAILLDFLATAPSAECERALAPRLVARLVPERRLRSVAALEVTPDGALQLNLGGQMDVDFLARVIRRLWDNPEVLGELRLGRSIAKLDDGGATPTADVCLPLTCGGHLRCAVACSLVAEQADLLVDLAERLTLISYLLSRPAGPDGHTMVGSSPDQSDGSERRRGLSARQIRILRAMAQGLTNRQIASQISYSESTVRLESMAIYKHYGVHTLHEAVAAALVTGDLPPTEG